MLLVSCIFNFFCPLNIGMLFSLCGSVEPDFRSGSVVKETDADGVPVRVLIKLICPDHIFSIISVWGNILPLKGK